MAYIPRAQNGGTTHSEAGTHPIVVASDVTKTFETGDGVHSLTFDVPAGSILGFIGPSGSGKTTTVRVMTGVLTPTQGAIEVLGAIPAEFDRETRERIGYMPQLSVLYPNLSVWENLSFLAALYGRKWRKPERLRQVLEFVELAGHEGKRVNDISGGMQRRLSLAATLVHQPELMFLDEPTAGIDPILRRKFWDRFTDLKDEGRTIIVTTQYVGEAAYCDYVAVLSDGKLLLVDTPEGLRRQAYGGDVLVVEFQRRPPHDVVEQARTMTGAVSCEPFGPRGLRLVVDEAGVALPKLSSWFAEHDIEIEQAEEYFPPFDDVFVELINSHREEPENEAGSGDASASLDNENTLVAGRPA